jgi:hypothetical protein
MRITTTSLLLTLVLAGCGRATVPSDVKMVGVGHSPDEIGPPPTPYGGVVEYNWFDFEGGGLSLGFAGLLSFDEVNGEMGFAPPYSLVYGFSYMFDTKLEGAVSAGTIQPLPTNEDSCYTTFEATGPIGSFTTTDVGNAITFASTDSEAAFSIGRVPADYPPETRDMFIYYSEISGWRPYPATGLVPGESSSTLEMEQKVLRPANFPFGETMEMKFPGGVALERAPVGSMPLPSSYVGNPQFVVPHEQKGVRLAWSGPRYDMSGAALAEGEQAACLDYFWPEGTAVPENAEGCAEASFNYEGAQGQIYTGPWSTDDGKVTFEWTVPEDVIEGEAVSLSIRLLGAVDREDFEYFGSYMVNPDGGDARCGRDAMSCEEGEWAFNPGYMDIDWVDPLDASCGDGTYPLDEAPLIPSLQGDPMHTMAEVTCRLADDGHFELTDDIMAKAYEYAEQYGAEGAVFLFTRTNSVEADVPDVKNAYDHRRVITPVLVNVRTVEMGRFWFGDFAGGSESEE